MELCCGVKKIFQKMQTINFDVIVQPLVNTLFIALFFHIQLCSCNIILRRAPLQNTHYSRLCYNILRFCLEKIYSNCLEVVVGFYIEKKNQGAKKVSLRGELVWKQKMFSNIQVKSNIGSEINCLIYFVIFKKIIYRVLDS